MIAHHEPPVGTPGWGTDVDKMLAFCGVHHNLRHFTAWTVEFDPGDDARVTVTSPDGSFTATETASEARLRHLHAADPTTGANTQAPETVEAPGLFDEPDAPPCNLASEEPAGYDLTARCAPRVEQAFRPRLARLLLHGRRRTRQPRAP